MVPNNLHHRYSSFDRYSGLAKGWSIPIRREVINMIFTNAKISKRGELNTADLKKWAKNALVFSLPLAILFLQQLQSGKSLEEALPLVYAALINALIDLLKKLLDGKK